MEPVLVFMCGHPAAGKTTFSIQYCKEHPGFVRISADVIRRILYGSEDVYGDPYQIYQELLCQMRTSLLSGFSVIYDATNLRKDFRMDFLTELEDIQCYKIIKILRIDEETAKIRHEGRGRSIPWEDLEHYFNIDDWPTIDEGWNVIEVIR